VFIDRGDIIKEVRITSFEELHIALKSYRKTNLWLFRGHSDPNWGLIPKAGRDSYNEFYDSELLKLQNHKNSSRLRKVFNFINTD
jgi:hypothetical protein